MEISTLNVRLLMTFYEVYRTGNLSRAASALGITQPNVTIGLNRLRKHFGDPLFVRTSKGMEPTAQAHEFAKGIEVALGALRDALTSRAAFVPATSDRTFRIAMSEIMQIVILPQLLAQVAGQAPGVRLHVVRPSDATLRAVEAAEVDLALGYFTDSGPNFHERTLVTRDFVCIASADHPRIRSTISVEGFYREKHVSHRSTGVAVSQPERILDGRRRRREIALTIPDLAGIDAVVARSELIATVPRVIAEFFAERNRIQLLEHPVPIRRYAVKYHWHDRSHLDPANIWLRWQVDEVFKNRRGKKGSAAA